MRQSIVQAMPMTEAEFGLLTSVFLWVYGLISPFAGYLADKFSRSRVIIGSLFIWSAVTWLTAHSTSFGQLLATRALMGISEACYIPAALALIADYHRGSTRSLATGIHMAGIMVGQSLGFTGGWIAEKYTWSSAFSLLGIFGVAYAIVLIFLLRDVPSSQRDTSNPEETEKQVGFAKGVKNLFSQRSFILTLAYWGLLGVVGWMIGGWLPTYYKEHFNLSQTTAGVYATGYLYPASLVGVLLGGFLADRWSRSNPRARILVPAIGLCIAAPGIFLASTTTVVTVTIFGFILYALTRAFTDSNMMPILCMVSDARYRATGYGILNLFSCIVGGIGIYAGGVLRDAKVDLSRMFQFASIVTILCAVMLFMLNRKLKKNPNAS
jgi:predicted MFS family arabinose efflux permease